MRDIQDRFRTRQVGREEGKRTPGQQQCREQPCFWRRCEVRLGIACSYMHTWILVGNVDADECPHASEHAILVRDSAERWEVVGLDRSTQGHFTGCLVRHTRKDRFDRFDRLIDQSIDRLFVVFPYATYGKTCPVEVESTSGQSACFEQKLLSPPTRHRCAQSESNAQQHHALHPKPQPQNSQSSSTAESELPHQEPQTPVSENTPSISATRSPRGSSR
jgi:hypothetical protein